MVSWRGLCDICVHMNCMASDGDATYKYGGVLIIGIESHMVYSDYMMPS